MILIRVRVQAEKTAILGALSVIQQHTHLHDDVVYLRQIELKAYDRATSTLRESYNQVCTTANAMDGSSSRPGGPTLPIRAPSHSRS
jgi:hypothetical protein